MGSRPARAPWLFGPVPDLLLGCGLGYGVVFLIFSIGGEPLRLAQPLFLLPLATVILSGPHYGATLLRVYERREDRRAYTLYAVWATLLVLGLFTWSVYDALVATWFFTVYMTWSPWHYTAQNFGVSVMFLRRAGVEIDPLARRLLRSSFVSSFLITFLVLHTGSEAGTFLPNPYDYETQVAGQALGIPHAIGTAALGLVTLAYLVCTLGAFALLARGAGLRPLGPALAIALAQALWFSLPFSVMFWGIRTGLDPLDSGTPAQYVFWTAIAHAVQYLFITTYFARASETWRGYSGYLGKCLAAGAAIWTLPAVVFAPDALGEREYAAGLAVLVAAGVNIHHFILDGAIWKLRSKRVASVLIRSDEPSAVPIAPRNGARWTVHALWAVLGSMAVIRIGLASTEHFIVEPSLRGGHYARAETALDALSWFGRDASKSRMQLAAVLARGGDLAGAEAQYLRSIELGSSEQGWANVAFVRSAKGDWPGVVDAYRESRAASSTAPQTPLAMLAMRAFYETGRPEQAHEVLAEVESGTPSGSDYAQLAGVARVASDVPVAIRAYREALRLEPERHSAANNLAWILATTSSPSARDPETAVELARRAVASQDPPDPNYLDTLAIAYGAAGQRDEALAAARRGLEIAERQGDEDMARTLRESLERYGSQTSR